MNAVALLAVSMVLLTIAYRFYGRFVARRLGVDASRRTPAHTRRDGVDFEPAPRAVVLGHHFASIAGAGPILGPIAAAAFGWLPALLWILVGSVFFGAVHDFTALVASLRHEGRSIGELIEEYIGVRGKRLFATFALATLVLVIAVFSDVIVRTFEAQPQVASASLLFIIAAVAFGLLTRLGRLSLGPATVVGLVLLAGSLLASHHIPLAMPATLQLAGITWTSSSLWLVAILAYVAIATVTPVWLLLQPRDYLNSFLLYAMMAGAVAGVFVAQPTIELEAFTAFRLEGVGSLFPLLFVTVACGAISGFHSLVASGTTSKQLTSEADAQPVGYGSMMIEAVLAVVALITAAVLSQGDYTAARGNPIALFSQGVGAFMASIGVPPERATTFVALTISAFALTTLDTCARLARFLLQELAESPESRSRGERPLLANRFLSTGLVVLAGGALAASGSFTEVWPVFGSANQLLAALSLLAVATWLSRKGVENRFVLVPMFFMYLVTIAALGQLIRTNLSGPEPNVVLALVSGSLLLLALELLRQAWSLMGIGLPLRPSGRR